MSLDDKLQINPIVVESKIIEFIQSTLKPRGIEGLVILYRDYIESLITSKLAISAVGKENVKILVTQGRFSSRRPTKERDLQTIHKYLSLPEDNIVQINIEDLHRDLSRIFLGKSDLIHGLTLTDSAPVLNYNLSYFLLREMARDDFDLQQFAPPIKKPKTEKDKFTQRSIAHHKSQIRLNMLLGYLLAESDNKTLMGNTNKTEWLLGLFTKFGTSHAVDILPLGTLYRSQVVQLAKYLKLEEFLQSKKDIPTRYKFFFNLTFHDVDRILIRLEEGFSENHIAQETKLPQEAIKRINFHYKGTKYARSVPLMPKF
ncbi:MAG: hypothetical protein ACXACU_14840 [Candidatus Hodarchaeales archaeon]|jgi:NH3-dependent NAD+ synthetase